ncbi:hypothetical protein [Paraburkholderia sp. JHI869]|uniref:hypothetical protein n=1 Tax=Paraburkholderia sp. JHI869 TaxID=3112959 RepID=UPI0031781AC0
MRLVWLLLVLVLVLAALCEIFFAQAYAKELGQDVDCNAEDDSVCLVTVGFLFPSSYPNADDATK